MQNRFGLLVTDVMPIYMIMPGYSHNYALFYQLLDNNFPNFGHNDRKSEGQKGKKKVNGKERANKMARVKWGRGKREANGK